MAKEPRPITPPSATRFAVVRNILLFIAFLGIAIYVLILKGELPSADPLKAEAGISERFWQLKVRGRQRAHVVILGDSRVNKGVSPETLTDQLPGVGWTGLNLGFRWGGLNSTIYEFAESRIDFSSAKSPIVVLGVSPGTLTLERNANRHFYTLRNRSALLALAYIYFPRITGMLSTGEVDAEIKGFPGQTEYHDNGWQGASRTYDSWPDAWLNAYRNIDRISPDLWSDLMERTRLWTENGVHVFAFRPPISPVLRKIEEAKTKFEEGRFSREFEANGGTWIDIEASEFHTYDNNHLPRDEAVRLSRKLGRKIAESLANTGPSSGTDSE